MKMKQRPDIKSFLMLAWALLMTFHYGSAADCELDITSSALLGRPMFGENIGPYNIGLDLTLVCSISKGDCGKLAWWDEEGSLLIDSATLKLSLGPCDAGRRLMCTAEKKASKTVQLVISDEESNPCTTTKQQTTATATMVKASRATSSTKASTTTTTHEESTSFASVMYVRNSHRSRYTITTNSDNNARAKVRESVHTVAVRQGTPVPATSVHTVTVRQGTPVPATSVHTVAVRQGTPVPVTMTSGSAEEDNWTHYLIIGGVIVVGGLALAALITTLFLFKKVNKVGAASHPSPPSASAQERSEVPSSAENTRVNIGPLTILDINDLPPITPLTVGKPRVGGPYDPLLTGGGASFAADSRDHSYYYPEEPDSYHYPNISQDVREQILRNSNDDR